MKILLKKMDALKTNMLDVGVDLEYFAGFNKDFIYPSSELKRASKVLQQWIDYISHEHTKIKEKE